MLKHSQKQRICSENVLFRPKYEELVVKSLSLKNRSKEPFRSVKNEGSSKEGNRSQLFQKDILFRTRERGMFIAAGQTFQQQYPTRRTGKE